MSFIKNNLYYKSPQQQAAYVGATQAAAGITSLLPEESNPYAFDKFSGLKGAAQGAQMGAAFGPIGAGIGAAAGAIAGVAGEAIQDRKLLKNTPTSFQTVSYDENWQPVFQSQGLSQGLNNLQNINEAINKKPSVLGGVLTTGGSLFNKKLRRDTANKLSEGIERAQDTFNEANIMYSKNLLARAQYEDALKRNNVYNFPMQLV